MADMVALKSRLLTWAPGTTDSEREAWLTEAITQHGYNSVADIPANLETAIVAFAAYFGMKAKSAETAGKGSVSVKGVSVGKGNVSGNYEVQAKRAWTEYLKACRQARIRPVGAGTVTKASFSRPDGR